MRNNWEDSYEEEVAAEARDAEVLTLSRRELKVRKWFDTAFGLTLAPALLALLGELSEPSLLIWNSFVLLVVVCRWPSEVLDAVVLVALAVGMFFAAIGRAIWRAVEFVARWGTLLGHVLAVIVLFPIFAFGIAVYILGLSFWRWIIGSGRVHLVYWLGLGAVVVAWYVSR